MTIAFSHFVARLRFSVKWIAKPKIGKLDYIP